MADDRPVVRGAGIHEWGESDYLVLRPLVVLPNPGAQNDDVER